MATNERSNVPARISIVIPTLNEAGHIRGTLDGLRQADVYEIIVADGGSGDKTADIAEACGATVVRCERGRGRQLNAGAESAGGEILYFYTPTLRFPPVLQHGFVSFWKCRVYRQARFHCGSTDGGSLIA